MITQHNQGSATELRCDRCEKQQLTKFHSPRLAAMNKSLLIADALFKGWIIQSNKNNNGPDLCPGCRQELKGVKSC